MADTIKMSGKGTIAEFAAVIDMCKGLFMAKTIDYGTAWRILRMSSLTDQIYIKARRIRSLEETGVNLVGESAEMEYVGIINYSIMAIIQLQLPPDAPFELTPEFVEAAYNTEVAEIMELLARKNHDYGEAWREMRISSLTDLILMKLIRVKQIEDNNGQTLVSEGMKANYQDMVNYAAFALIRYNAQPGTA